MENNNLLFDHIKDRLDAYESPLNLEEEWNTLARRNHKQSFMKKYRLYILLLCLIIATSGLVGYFAGKGQHDSTITLQQAPPMAEGAPVSNDKSPTQKPELSGEKMEQPSTPLVNHSSEIHSTPKQSTPEDTISSLKSQPDLSNLDAGFTKQPPSGNPSTFLTPHKTQKHFTTNNNTNISTMPAEEVPSLLTNPQQTVSTATPLTLKGLAIGKMEGATINPLTDQQLSRYLREPFQKPKIKRHRSATGHKPGIYFGSGLFVTQQQFSAKEASDENYRQLRTDTESPLETNYYDIGVKVRLTEHLYATAGVNYARSYDKFTYSYETPKDYALSDVLLKIRRRPDGTLIEEIRGDTVVAGTQMVKATYYNTYRSTNVNILLGYQFLKKEKWDMSASGGLDWNLHTTSQGHIAAPTSASAMSVLQLGDGNSVYQKNFGIGLSANLALTYWFTDNWGIQLRPVFSYYLPSVTSSDYQLDAHILRYGAVLGLNYQL